MSNQVRVRTDADDSHRIYIPLHLAKHVGPNVSVTIYNQRNGKKLVEISKHGNKKLAQTKQPYVSIVTDRLYPVREIVTVDVFVGTVSFTFTWPGLL